MHYSTRPERRKTRQVKVGKIAIGGDAPVSVQSMTTTNTWDAQATLAQIHELEQAGCEIVRCTVPTEKDAAALPEILAGTKIPVVADIHFDYRMALKAAEAGVNKLRLNPGNIGGEKKVQMVVDCAKAHKLPIRIGVNAGSLEKELLEKYLRPTPEAMYESGMRHIKILEEAGFYDIVISLKASDPKLMIDSYSLLATRCDYPFHLGVTEAGTKFTGTIKNAIGMGALLEKGIGDTIRVSLTAEPVEEVKAGFEILKALRIREKGINLIACPTCGRLEIDLFKLCDQVEARLKNVEEPIEIAIMGCVVNGPGEAQAAKIGLAAGRGQGVLYLNGEVVKKVKEEDMLKALVEQVEQVVGHPV